MYNIHNKYINHLSIFINLISIRRHCDILERNWVSGRGLHSIIVYDDSQVNFSLSISFSVLFLEANKVHEYRNSVTSGIKETYDWLNSIMCWGEKIDIRVHVGGHLSGNGTPVHSANPIPCIYSYNNDEQHQVEWPSQRTLPNIFEHLLGPFRCSRRDLTKKVGWQPMARSLLILWKYHQHQYFFYRGVPGSQSVAVFFSLYVTALCAIFFSINVFYTHNWE